MLYILYSLYYLSLIDVKHIILFEDINYSISLENIVYNELIGKGYKVFVGKTKKGEIDFVRPKIINLSISKYVLIWTTK